MSDTLVLQIARDALTITLMVAGPVLLVGLAVGLIVSILQAATQIQEMTLAYVPKILAVFGVIAVLGPWMMNQIVTYTTNLFEAMPSLIR